MQSISTCAWASCTSSSSSPTCQSSWQLSVLLVLPARQALFFQGLGDTDALLDDSWCKERPWPGVVAGVGILQQPGQQGAAQNSRIPGHAMITNGMWHAQHFPNQSNSGCTN